MIRETSVEAYEAIQESGVLSKRRWQAYNYLFHNGPLTGQELCRQTGVNGLWKRLSELQEMGLAKECGERPCKVTGMTAILWDVTAGMPRALQRTKAESAKQKVQRLLQEVEHWKKRALAAEGRWEQGSFL
jgi:hypothetical protein